LLELSVVFELSELEAELLPCVVVVPFLSVTIAIFDPSISDVSGGKSIDEPLGWVGHDLTGLSLSS
jgi:hypothetical protein